MSHVLLIDANAVFRLGLREVIRTVQPGLAISEADTFAEACAVLRSDISVALIVFDIIVRDSGGLAGLLLLRSEFPDVPVIVLSNNPKTDQIRRAVAFGAAGFIQKSASCDAIFQILKKILSGQGGATPVVSSTENQNPISTLSPGLLRVLMGVKRGLRNKEIAYELGLSEKTIKAYLGMLFRKLGVSNRTQAVILLQEVLAEAQLESAFEEMPASLN